jgi:glycosyltransferase involved in cell wall biosynthesis
MQTHRAAEGRPLAVGLNLLYLVDEAGGSGRYSRELLRAMLAVDPAVRFTVFGSRELPRDFVEHDWDGRVDLVRLPVTVTEGPPWNMALTMRAQWLSMPRIARGRGLDLVHGLTNVVPLVSLGIPSVVTLLDLIWMHYRQTLSWRATVGMRLTAPPSARRATRVIAISEAAKRDIVETLELEESKVDVTPLGIRVDPAAPRSAEADVRAQLELGSAPVILSVAQKREHKNLAGLIRAFALLEDRRPVLVLPGAPTPHEAELRALAGELDVADRVRFPGWLSNPDLEALYRLSTCFVLPSFEEGFGLPVLEAMARGVPVACSNVSSLPEVAGDAAELFDPSAPEDIARAVTRLLGEPARRVELVSRGEARCREFTWERTARATLASYERALGRRA